MLCGWLGGFESESEVASQGRLLTIEDVGKILDGMLMLKTGEVLLLIFDSATVPINVKDRDVFHLTIEEYLLSIVSLVEELVC